MEFHTNEKNEFGVFGQVNNSFDSLAAFTQSASLHVASSMLTLRFYFVLKSIHQGS